MLNELIGDTGLIQRIGRLVHGYDPYLREEAPFDHWMKFWIGREDAVDHFALFVFDIQQTPELYDGLTVMGRADVDEFIKILGVVDEVEALYDDALVTRDEQPAAKELLRSLDN